MQRQANMADLFVKHVCTYCQEEISGLRVKCVDCTDFEMCLQCFSAGAEVGPHRNDHSYQFVDAGTVSLSFGKNQWSAKEELHLLDAVEVYGFGNWEDISRHIETRTPDEAKEQYVSRYLEGTIGRLTWPPALNRRPNLSDAANLDCGPLSPSGSGRLPSLDITAEEAKQLVYMPLRDDFESEFSNDAESLLAPLCINGADEDDLDLALTLAQVDMYVQTLRERARRKRVSRDYQLVSNFFRKDKIIPKKKLTKEEKDFQDGMQAFCQFHTATEHEQFLQNMQREQELKIRLTELARYRRHGITRHEECAHLEQELLAQQPMGSSGANPIPPALHPQVSTYLRKRGRSEEPVWCSNERRSIFASLGNPLLAKLIEPQGVNVPGAAKLLSRQESTLCTGLSLLPSEYLALKAALLKEGEVGEQGPKGGIERNVQMFLSSQNWLPG